MVICPYDEVSAGVLSTIQVYCLVYSKQLLGVYGPLLLVVGPKILVGAIASNKGVALVATSISDDVLCLSVV